MRQGRTKNCEHEYTREQKLSKSNKVLQREVARLRKELEKFLQREGKYQELEALVRKRVAEERNKGARKQLEKKWKCFACGEGVLELKILLPRRDGAYYARHCTNCTHKTKSKKYTEGMEEG